MSNFYFAGTAECAGYRNDLWVSHSYKKCAGLSKDAEFQKFHSYVEKIHNEALKGEVTFYDEAISEMVSCIVKQIAGQKIAIIYIGLSSELADGIRQSLRE